MNSKDIKKDIKDFTLEELKREMHRLHEPLYRAKQVFSWVYKKGASDFKDMSNLAVPFIDSLSRFYYIGNIKIRGHFKSVDSTEKFLFELSEGGFIEAVLIYSSKRKTLCLSTQVGCKYGCLFCASGLKGFIRNLTVSEILDQILLLQQNFGYRITNFVFMGMGEPLDNYENLSKAIMIMNCPEGLGIGARRITVSTCGIIPGIQRFKEMGIQVNLSISLHAADNKLRDSLMPINKKYPLERLFEVCEHYIKQTHRKLTLEYVLLKDKNDSMKDANGLSSIAKRLNAKVNLIPYSPVQGKAFNHPMKKDVIRFKNKLIENGLNVTVRESKGKDIQAGCGQLVPRDLDS